MPRCSHGVPFENKCEMCVGAAMLLYPALAPRTPTYPVQVALRQDIPTIVAVRTVLDPELKETSKA